MSGTTISSSDLDIRRRKALYRSWRRGMREVDLILGAFADGEIARLGDAELGLFEALMDEADGDILSWVTGEKPAPGEHDTALFARVCAYRGRA